MWLTNNFQYSSKLFGNSIWKLITAYIPETVLTSISCESSLTTPPCPANFSFPISFIFHTISSKLNYFLKEDKLTFIILCPIVSVVLLWMKQCVHHMDHRVHYHYAFNFHHLLARKSMAISLSILCTWYLINSMKDPHTFQTHTCMWTFFRRQRVGQTVYWTWYNGHGNCWIPQKL